MQKSLVRFGFTSNLRRVRVGDFRIEDSGRFIEFENILNIDKIEINDLDYKKCLNGILINVNGFNDGLVKIFNNRKFKGIGIISENNLKRKIILD